MTVNGAIPHLFGLLEEKNSRVREGIVLAITEFLKQCKIYLSV
jgi:hypothetical protein